MHSQAEDWTPSQDSLFSCIHEAGLRGDQQGALANDLWRRFGETLVILVLDSTGFTRTTRKKGIVHFLTLLCQARQAYLPLLVEHHVIAWRAVADNIFATFPSVDSAVGFAFSAHRHFSNHPLWIDEHEPLRVCVGIGYGRVLRSEREGVFGDEVNLASKIGEDLARGNETLLTEAAFAHLQNRGRLHIESRTMELSGVAVPCFSLLPLAD